MNDPIIRKAFHFSFLQKDHASPNTLVVDEFGIEHGKCRADIAVINGQIKGYEIKSEKDSLARLKSQIEMYNAVFDYSSIVLEKRHLMEVLSFIPHWWGIILVLESDKKSVCFETIRDPSQNQIINDYMVAQLLWRNEAQEILRNFGLPEKQLRECRANLYQYIVDMFDSQVIRKFVRDYLKKRQGWRDRELTSQYDGLFPFVSM